LAVDTESDVTDKGFVDDGVDRFALVAAAITLATRLNPMWMLLAGGILGGLGLLE